MNRLAGVVVLAAAPVLPYSGWRFQQAVAPAGDDSSHSVGMLALGSIAAVWEVCALLRRTALWPFPFVRNRNLNPYEI